MEGKQSMQRRMNRGWISGLALLLLLSGCKQDPKEITESETDSIKEEHISEPTEAIISHSYTEPQAFRKGIYGAVYMLHLESGNILIDAGYYDEELDGYLQENGGLEAVLITHGHYDHIGGIDQLKQSFPDAAVYINEQDQKLLTDTELNCSHSMSEPVIVNSETEPLNEGVYEIAGSQVEVIHFGGHTAGSNLYYFPEENVLFTGDAILPESLGPVRPTGSQDIMDESARELIERGFPDDMRVYCGHNGDTTYENLLKFNQGLTQIR